MVIALVSVAGLGAQAPQDDEAVWKAFMTWFKDAPAVRGNPVAAYGAVLQKAGTPDGEVKRQAGVLMRQIMSGRSDWIEPFYDMTFSKLLTGDPATDGFTGEPSALLIEAVKGLTAGNGSRRRHGAGAQRRVPGAARLEGDRVRPVGGGHQVRARRTPPKPGFGSTRSRPAMPTSTSAPRSGTSSF